MLLMLKRILVVQMATMSLLTIIWGLYLPLENTNLNGERNYALAFTKLVQLSMALYFLHFKLNITVTLGAYCFLNNKANQELGLQARGKKSLGIS